MENKRVLDYHNSATLQQLWDALGSKLIQAAQGSLTFNQGAAGSRPARPTSFSRPSLLGDFQKNQGVNSLGQPTP
jgi:hypothetical protein